MAEGGGRPDKGRQDSTEQIQQRAGVGPTGRQRHLSGLGQPQAVINVCWDSAVDKNLASEPAGPGSKPSASASIYLPSFISVPLGEDFKHTLLPKKLQVYNGQVD